MEFSGKLQELRKNRGLTQEELAQALFVSRTAISKWESGRGYPNIDSLKAIAKFFSVTVDELLSGEEILSVAEEDRKVEKSRSHDLIFGLLDLSSIMLLFLPMFGQKTQMAILSVPLLSLSAVAPYLLVVFYGVVLGMAFSGLSVLVLQFCTGAVWRRCKRPMSLVVNGLGVVCFILSTQVYAAVFLFILLTIKVLVLLKK